MPRDNALALEPQPENWTAILGGDDIAPIRLGDAVIERLTQAILDGRLKPGDALPSEGRIAARFGISKPIAREALRELAAMGVIQVQQGKTSRVRAIDSGPLARFYRFAIGNTRQGMLDAVELRRMIEPQIARVAAGRRTPADIVALQAVFTRMKSSLGQISAWMEADLAFHNHLAVMTHNSLIMLQSKALEPVVGQMMVRFNARTEREMPDWEATFLRHAKVADAVIAGDAAAAETAMRQHFEAAEAAIAEIYGANPASDRAHREDNHVQA
ncbi:MAG: FadR family transcriptional regulator [Methylobacterium sp.]|jgi:GntR family transcriptional repressor for pyruvate dehydrogenase complex|nr:FadR family transcriptional regulator [Methylobacterium sp.]MCA3619123.1 FadR family transcriptional regulator [Methylobacterium sp.]MCA3621044.1 FadR family transcriptional regulator [Methylobacterium sp.]